MTLPPDVPPLMPQVRAYGGRSSAYFDGNNPVPRDVTLKVGRDVRTLEIGFLSEVATGVRWPLSEIRLLEDTAGKESVVLRWVGDPLARLHLQDRSALRYMPNLMRSAPPNADEPHSVP